jgi:hypothetical protein
MFLRTGYDSERRSIPSMGRNNQGRLQKIPSSWHVNVIVAVTQVPSEAPF